MTLGSSVPLWPVFSTLKTLLTQDTTSCEEGFEGLSRLIKPHLKEINNNDEVQLINVNARADPRRNYSKMYYKAVHSFKKLIGRNA